MEMEIVEKKLVRLLGRTEIVARITFTGKTPTNESVMHAIASKMKIDAGLVVINSIRTDYGFCGATVSALCYENKESFDMFKQKMGKKALEKIKKEQEAKAAALKEAEEAKRPKEEKGD